MLCGVVQGVGTGVLVGGRGVHVGTRVPRGIFCRCWAQLRLLTHNRPNRPYRSYAIKKKDEIERVAKANR